MHRRLLVIVLLFALIGSGVPLPATAQGQVYTDTMDSAATGLLSTDTFDPTISFAYLNGQFVIDVQQPAYDGNITSTVDTPAMNSSRTTVDAAIAGDLTGKFVYTGCRQTDAGEGYRFGYWPATGYLSIWRQDAAGPTVLAEQTDPALIDLDPAGFQIGIDCWTGILTGIVNGQPVISANDITYAFGRPVIGVGAFGQQTDGLRVAFDNLTVTDNGNVALGPETPTTVATAAQTAPMRDPNVDPDGALADAFTVSLETAPLVGEISQTISLPLGSLQVIPANVQVADFYAEVIYPTPALPVNTSYVIGFCFWTDPAGNCFDVFLQDLGGGVSRWGYGYDVAGGDYQPLQTGELPAGSVDPTPGASNFLSLTVYNGVAILSGNTFEVGVSIPLQGTPLAGNIGVELGFIDSGVTGVIAPLEMSIERFGVWDLSSGLVPVASGDPTAAPGQPTAAAVTSGPALPPIQATDGVAIAFEQTRTAVVQNPPLAAGYAGELNQDAAAYSYLPAAVDVADFYTIVTFTNPADLSVPSDVGIGFRDDRQSEGGLRFVIDSTGTWYMQIPGQPAYASGAVPGFDPSPGASTTVELLVQGATGTIAVNGNLLPQFDLSTVTNRGDIYIGTGFFQGDTVAGRTIPYSNWWIYPTDVLDFPVS